MLSFKNVGFVGYYFLDLDSSLKLNRTSLFIGQLDMG